MKQLTHNTTIPVILMQTAGTWQNKVQGIGLGWRKGSAVFTPEVKAEEQLRRKKVSIGVLILAYRKERGGTSSQGMNC